jgi:serine/threonine protein kinase
MATELARSEELRKAVAQQVANPETDFARFQGFGSVVTVLGTCPDGSIIQERIQGRNLFESLRDPMEDSPYGAPGGFPQDLQGAKQRALGFASEMMSLHAAGKVHCDMKPHNLMLDQEGHLHVIDLGGLKNSGDVIGAHSLNGGPEFTAKAKQLNMIGAEMKSLKEEYNAPSGVSSERKIALENRWNHLKIQHERLWRQLGSFKVDPSYDIFAEGSVLPGLWFGREGLAMSGQFWDGSTDYLAKTRDMGYEERTAYFKEQFVNLNERMGAATGQQYSSEDMDKMSSLMTWMMDPEPSHRPTSEQVFTQLSDLSNIH